MSTHVGIVVLLCLLLIFAMIRHRSSRAAGTGDEARQTSAKSGFSKPTLRLRRGSHTSEPEPPRQRRNRPRLGLTVSGVPTEEALLSTSPTDATAEPLDAPEQSVEASDAAILELASGAAPAEAAAPAARDTVPDDAIEDIPVALRGVVQDDAVIEAAGWPQPGELGLASATDGFVAPTAELETAVADDRLAEPVEADAPLTVPTTDDLMAADVPAEMWDEEFAEFDPASGWGSADEDPAEPAFDQEWEAAALDQTLDDAWARPEAADDEALTEDAAVLDGEQDWSSSEWDFATVAAAPLMEIEGAAYTTEPVADHEPASHSAGDDEPTFSWPGEERAIELDEVIDLDPVPPAFEAVVADSTYEVSSPAHEDIAAPDPTPDQAAWEPAPMELPEPAPAWTAATPQKTPKVDKRTRRLEKRLAVAEAELRRVAKRTRGKKGDLRKAGKDRIAKQVRKALGDPALAHHFDLEVGKGRFAFERRSGALPVVTIGEGRPGGEGSELLGALEGPMRANLLAMLLRDYAHSEADRRVAALTSRSGRPADDPDGFDALVARLAELSQGALLDIEPLQPRS